MCSQHSLQNNQVFLTNCFMSPSLMGSDDRVIFSDKPGDAYDIFVFYALLHFMWPCFSYLMLFVSSFIPIA